MKSNFIFSNKELQTRTVLTKILNSTTDIVNELTISHRELLSENIEQLMEIVDRTRNIGKNNTELIFNDPNQIIYFKYKNSSNYIYGVPKSSINVDKYLYAHDFTCFECYDKNCCTEAFNIQNLYNSCILGKKIQ